MTAKKNKAEKPQNQKSESAKPSPPKTAKNAELHTRKAPPKKTVKKKAITAKAFEKWFLNLESKDFMSYCVKWNEENLKIKIPRLDDYDEWFNYFAKLPARVTQKLADSGTDLLPTDGYSALARWHDIVSHPSRIDKVHQSGLTGKSKGKGVKSISQLAQENDRLGVLKATRDRIAEKLEKGAGARDTAALAREMTEIMTQIADYEKRQGPKKSTKLGQLLGDVDLRKKRPGKNGGGSRNTSFKSRVTIRDVEG